MSRITTRAEAQARQAEVRKKVLALIGGLPHRMPLNARLIGSTQADGFRIEKVIFDSQPNYPVTALLYLPNARPGSDHGRLPAVIISPGHSPLGKTSDYFLAAAFARNGFAVLDYDIVGEGERLLYLDPAMGQSRLSRPTGEHGEAGLQPTLIGDTAARYFLWDAMRGVDYLQSLPKVDPGRIGAFGCSGGGTVTAYLGALDSRIKAIGTACFITSYDTLLPSIGPQDSEQSIPRFISSGLDFPDWIELAAPRPYAVIATYDDMFPYAGTQQSVDEARRFYRLFGPNAKVEFLTGPGHHGNLGPILPRILSFFLRNLQPGSDWAHPVLPPSGHGSPFALPANIPPSAFQDTPTGQVYTSYPNAATIFSLNIKRAASILPKDPFPRSGSLAALQTAIREVTHAVVMPEVSSPGVSKDESRPATVTEESSPSDAGAVFHRFTLHPADALDLHGELAAPASIQQHHPAILLLTNAAAMADDSPEHAALIARMSCLSQAGNVVLALTPRPSPPGTEETKSPILGDFYLTELRAELTGKTLLGMRVDDTIRTLNYLASLPGVDPHHVTAFASGHLGLVLLHAAVLDPGVEHISIDHTLSSYRSLLEAPMPIHAPEDILPGVLLHYDLPDLVRALGPRLTITAPLSGEKDLSAISTQ